MDHYFTVAHIPDTLAQLEILPKNFIFKSPVTGLSVHLALYLRAAEAKYFERVDG
jgi:hypothetical protein